MNPLQQEIVIALKYIGHNSKQPDIQKIATTLVRKINKAKGGHHITTYPEETCFLIYDLRYLYNWECKKLSKEFNYTPAQIRDILKWTTALLRKRATSLCEDIDGYTNAQAA